MLIKWKRLRNRARQDSPPLRELHPFLVFFLLAVSLAGCSILPLESYTIPHPSSRMEPAVGSGYQEIDGVIHIHTTFSDGSLPIESVAKIANAQQLDYLIVTDHNTLRGKREGKEGWYGKTLVLIDQEISTNGGHYLALRLPKEIPKFQSQRWTIEAVSAQGGLGFVAHPFWSRRPWKGRVFDGITGIEIYSAVEDVSEENALWLGAWTIFAGSEFSLLKWLDRPRESLNLWDQLLARGNRVVGIGSPDAHGLRRFGLRLGPYTTMFRLVRTHLLVKQLSPAAIYDALNQGHAFVVHDLLASGKGFLFVALRRNSVRAVMGDSIRWSPALRLYAYLPSPGEIVFLKDGQVVVRIAGQHGWLSPPGPGVYRVEASRKGRPWIYSNPIYVVK